MAETNQMNIDELIAGLPPDIRASYQGLVDQVDITRSTVAAENNILHPLMWNLRTLGSEVEEITSELEYSKIEQGLWSLARSAELMLHSTGSLRAQDCDLSKAMSLASGQSGLPIHAATDEKVFFNDKTLVSILAAFFENARDILPSDGTVQLDISRAPAEHGAPKGYTQVHLRYDDIYSGTCGSDLRHGAWQKVYPASKTDRNHLSLGYSVAILERYGGNFSFEKEGKRSHVTLAFPNGHPRRLLLVEDNIFLNNGISELLQQEGWEVKAVGDGVKGIEEYLKMYQENKVPSVVLTDAEMQNLNGIGLYSLIKRLDGSQHILLMSGKKMDNPGSLESNFLQKPFSLKNFYEKLIYSPQA